MYLTQEKPYRPLLVALMFLTLPLAMILHNIVQIAFSDGQGLLVTAKDGVWAWQSGWQDSVAWFVCGMFAFLNLPIAGGLTKLAYKKMMRRHSRYAIFLAGVAACASAAAGLIFEAILGNAALAGMRGQGVFYYTLRMDHRHADPAQTAHARAGAAHRLSQDETLIQQAQTFSDGMLSVTITSNAF